MNKYIVIIRAVDVSEYRVEVEASCNKDAELKAIQHFALDMGRVYVITHIQII